MGVLRWRSALDEEISQTSSQAVSKLDPEVLTALRLALYQLRKLDRIPPRAAIHESVELVKRARKRSAVPFVNAVLRKLAAAARLSHASTSTEEDFASAELLAGAFAHPAWLVERWVRAYGLAAAQQICRHDQSVPATAIRLRDSAAENDLRAEGIDLAPGALLASARRVSTANISQASALLAGQAVIQDEASQLVAALVGRGSRILDCCAAPGGKTLAMADYNPGATITAIELHPHRARLLQKLLRSSETSPSARPPNIQIITADVQTAPLHANYDRVLVDVPCSGTGTLARNPEIKWRLQPDDLEDLRVRQLAILRSALKQVAPGGRLIYSTCSLEKEENENVVEEVLEEALKQNSTFRLLDVRPELDRLKSEGVLTWPDLASLTRGPFLRTLPGIHPCDAFFAAIFEKL
jgi:16S rRNA (cytosine967-C5)-methyltransferase